MSYTPSILIVEDEEAIRIGLTDVLIYHGFKVDSAEDGLVGLNMAKSGKYDLLLIDVMLPSMNGFDICQAVRETDKSQPIIMLTAKSSDEDVINGLQLGADDYVAKPFSVTQLILRIKAVLKRSVPLETSKAEIKLNSTTVIDTLNLTIESEHGGGSFTKREVQLLEYLHAHNQKTCSREELLSAVWGYAEDFQLETRTVDIHIARIRRKIEKDPKAPVFLVTVRGAGYRLLSES